MNVWNQEKRKEHEKMALGQVFTFQKGFFNYYSDFTGLGKINSLEVSTHVLRRLGGN
jgi:hypothetical protein